MNLYNEIFYPTENYLYKAAKKYGGKYYEDKVLIESESLSSNGATTQKIVIAYHNFKTTIVSSKINGIIILLDLKSSSQISFKILPISSTGIIKKIIRSLTKNTESKSRNFIYSGNTDFGGLIKQSETFKQLYDNNEYVIEIKKNDSSKIIFKPFHGIGNLEELENCLKILIEIARTIVSK